MHGLIRSIRPEKPKGRRKEAREWLLVGLVAVLLILGALVRSGLLDALNRVVIRHRETQQGGVSRLDVAICVACPAGLLLEIIYGLGG